MGGGLFDGHLFTSQPPMTRSCTACHGSRVGNEYLGKNEGYPGDVHFREGRMNCVDCHTSHELHGQNANCSECHTAPEEMSLKPADHRYAGIQSPTCEKCHPNTILGKDNIQMHTVHGSDLSCEVCHSITYTSCDGCHVAISEKTGKAFFETEATYSTFLIGLNPSAVTPVPTSMFPCAMCRSPGTVSPSMARICFPISIHFPPGSMLHRTTPRKDTTGGILQCLSR